MKSPRKDAGYRPPLADYFDSLERQHGARFSFDRLREDELQTLARLARDAIAHDPLVSAVEKKNLGPLLTLIDLQLQKRRRGAPH